jgi:hypothetical protein
MLRGRRKYPDEQLEFFTGLDDKVIANSDRYRNVYRPFSDCDSNHR